jgi:hypothetical protein
MPSAPPDAWDWRDGSAYAPLVEVERAGFAWEWLRRDSAYRRDAQAHLRRERDGGQGGFDRQEQQAAACWGLHVFEDWRLPATHARPVWRRRVLRHVLRAVAEEPAGFEDRFLLDDVRAGATLVHGAEGEQHLLLAAGGRSVRLDVSGRDLRQGPVMLRYILAGRAGAEAPLLVLRRFLALERTGRFSAALHPRETKAKRWIWLLRAHDALAAGASQREIARHLLGADAGLVRWRVEASTLRSQVQRLVRQSRIFAAGGYLELLR